KHNSIQHQLRVGVRHHGVGEGWFLHHGRGYNMKTFARFTRLQAFSGLLAIILIFALPLAAQNATGRIVGVVTDPTGSVIPKAKVTVKSAETGVTSEALTETDGSYQVLLLPVGTYSVTAEAQGFRKAVTNLERLDVNQSLRIDIKLEVGATIETVQVE